MWDITRCGTNFKKHARWSLLSLKAGLVMGNADDKVKKFHDVTVSEK